MIRVGKKTYGFTIVEVLIVLSSTGVLLLIGLSFIGNQVNHTGFQTGTRSFQTQLQTILNQVTSGNYTFPTNVQCKGGNPPLSNNSNTPTLASISSTQGTNNGCIFLGKALFIGNNSTGSQNLGTFSAYSVVGNQCASYSLTSSPYLPCQSFPTTLNDSNPVLSEIPETIDNYIVEGGLRINYITSDHPNDPTAGTKICGFGIINAPTGNTYGASFGLYALDTLSPTCSNTPSNTPPPPQYPDNNINDSKRVNSIQICLNNGSNAGQKIELNISYSSSGGSTTLGQAYSVAIAGTALC